MPPRSPYSYVGAVLILITHSVVWVTTASPPHNVAYHGAISVKGAAVLSQAGLSLANLCAVKSIYGELSIWRCTVGNILLI